MGRAKARKQRQTPPLSLAVQRQRTAEALSRGAFQKARELAQELCRQAPSAEHRQWLAAASIGRAAELRAAGQNTQATALLRGIIDMVSDTAVLLARCAGEFFLLGEWQSAQQLAARVSDASLLSNLHALHLDAAILHGEAGLASLPEEQREEAQRVFQALARLDRQDDAGAQEIVAGIPSASPAHDWKLFIRGLTAFYASDPTTLECWQQLTPERLPAALAAPFRAQIDPAFVAEQAEAVRAELTAFGRRLHTASWLSPLEDTQRLLMQEALPTALRRAGEAARAMPPESQALRQRLAHVLYWTVIQHGSERDIVAYRKAFGAPPDDPELHRLQALFYEQEEDLIGAQEWWAKYDADVQQHGMGSDADTALARALVWLHMGELAEKVSPPVPPTMHMPMPPGFDDEDDEDIDCPFPALDCYQRSIALAPQYLAAHEHLLSIANKTEQHDEAVATAQRLLTYFPEHEGALEVLADHAFRQERWDEAVAYQERAVQGRPHDTSLTERLSFYALGLARQRAQQGQFDAARAILATELARETTSERYHILCRQAAVEIKAGQPQRGEELFAQACQMATYRLPVLFQMLIEAIRMPLERKRITQFDRDFRRGLKDKAEAPSALAMLNLLKAFAGLKISYEALPAHQKLILQYTKRLLQAPLSEAELQNLCSALELVSDNKLLLDFAIRGCREFPRNPHFPYAAVKYYMALGPERCPMSKLHANLERALALAQANPDYAELAHDIEALQRVIQTLSFLGELSQHMDDFDLDDEPPPELAAALAELLGVPGGMDWFDDDDDDDGWGYEPPQPAPRGGAHRTRRKR